MYVLGVSALYHDSAAALLCDGVLVAAAQEERFSRIKYDHRMPVQAIQYCLREAGIQAKDLDFVAFYEKPLLKFERIFLSHLGTFPRSWKVFREAMIAWFGDKLWLKATIASTIPVLPDRILFVDHHTSHAASAMFCAPFAQAAVLSVDGVGEWTTTALGLAGAAWDDGARNAIDLSEELRFPHSLGLLYSAFTAWLGFKVNSGEYKVMGMAAYGKPKYMDRLSRIVRVYEDGSIRLNLDYFSFHHSLTDTYNKKFVDVFGPPRPPESPFVTSLTNPELSELTEEARLNQYYADVAASIQRLTEEVLLKAVRHLHRVTGQKNLVMAGGVALNSVANGRIMRESPFEQVYIQPNAGDAGGALGAALYVWHVVLGNPRRFVMEHTYYGERYSDWQIRQALEHAGLRYEHLGSDDGVADRAVDALRRGEVVAISQGRFEWGPRALGNRSILADPRRPDMKEIVNTKIKFREQFRPFAPVVPEDDANRYFDMRKVNGQYPPRFMLMVAPALSSSSAQIPAVVHMGTGRLQTVRKEWNPLYYGVIRGFGEATGVPVLLNTSFNLRGEPLVATPVDAINTFMASGIDLLLLERFLVRK